MTSEAPAGDTGTSSDNREQQAIKDAELPAVLHDDWCHPHVPDGRCWCTARERWEWAEAQKLAAGMPAEVLATVRQVIPVTFGDHVFIRMPNDTDPAHVGQMIDLLRQAEPTVTATVIISDNDLALQPEVVEQAARVLHEAFQKATATPDDPAGIRWEQLPPKYQAATRTAVEAVLRWLVGGGESGG